MADPVQSFCLLWDVYLMFMGSLGTIWLRMFFKSCQKNDFPEKGKYGLILKNGTILTSGNFAANSHFKY